MATQRARRKKRKKKRRPWKAVGRRRRGRMLESRAHAEDRRASAVEGTQRRDETNAAA